MPSLIICSSITTVSKFQKEIHTRNFCVSCALRIVVEKFVLFNVIDTEMKNKNARSQVLK